jgi:GH25 family lysozyme M1 (1,4-beta-N-acetylmuramidase)
MNRFQRAYNRIKRNLKRVSPEKLRELRDASENKWLWRSDVIGVGQSEKGIVIFKDKNKPSLEMDSFDAYTKSPLEIIETDLPQMLDWGQSLMSERKMSVPLREKEEYNLSVVPTKRIRPIYGGLSVSHKDVTAGTISLIVRDKTTKELLLLSNNHILANLNKGKKGDAIVQPGIADGGNVSTDTVGYLERFVEMRDGATADCAIAKLTSKDISRYGILSLGDVWFLENPKVSMAIEKFGRTTGFTTGKVTAINGTFKVGAGNTQYTVKEVFTSDIRSSGGDSGSALAERYTAKLLGILFAGNGSYTLGVTAKNVFEQLNIELMPCPYNIVLDLSHYNGKLTREMIRYAKARGVQALIFKMSEGNDYKDSEFENNVACAEAEGMPWTGYHFNKPSISASIQFNWLMKCLGTHVPSFQLMLDNEDTDGCNADKVTSVSLQLLNLIGSHFDPLGYKAPIYYSRGSWHNPNTLRSSTWKTYKLDAARYYVDQVKYYDDDPYFPYDWDNAVLWQCKADKDYLFPYFFGVTGTAKHIDVNYILDQAEFDSWLVHVPTPEEPDPEEPEIPEEPEPGEPTLKTGTHYYGKTLTRLNVRNAPTTKGTKLGTMSIGTPFEWFEEIAEGSDVWLRIGWKEYCAKLYNGATYIEYITV